MEISKEILSVLLGDESVYEQRVLVRQYSFYLQGILKEITVSIFYNIFMEQHNYEFRLSHYIHTPLQADAYIPTAPFAETEEFALHRAIATLTDYYKRAVSEGHTPCEEWLVKV